MIKSSLSLLFLAILTFVLNSCYTMPTEDDYSLIPSTNNPQMTRQRAESPLPQVPM